MHSLQIHKVGYTVQIHTHTHVITTNKYVVFCSTKFIIYIIPVDITTMPFSLYRRPTALSRHMSHSHVHPCGRHISRHYLASTVHDKCKLCRTQIHTCTHIQTVDTYINKYIHMSLSKWTNVLRSSQYNYILYRTVGHCRYTSQPRRVRIRSVDCAQERYIDGSLFKTKDFGCFIE